jgi:polar amino acid transport system substrate-binding protein
MMRYPLGSVFLMAALALSACGDNGGTGAASPTPTASEIPVIDIGECQTKSGETASNAEPLGVDYTEQLKEPGVLHIGSDNAYPPFENIEPGADEPTGFDVDLYTEVAERLDLDARSTTTDFDGLFTQSIPQGTFDLGVSAITITEERRANVDFTVPYFKADLSLAVNTEETPDIKTIDDLDGLTIGAQKGTTGEACAQVLVDQGKAAEVKSYGDAAAAFQDLGTGRIAAIVNDAPASQGFIDKTDNLAVVQVIRTNERYGFAISKEKPDLRVKVDEVLTEIMQDGTYAAIYEDWFGTPPPYEVPITD